MKTVYDLNRDELNELKQARYIEEAEAEGNAVSYGELADSENISDEYIFEVYADTMFSDDDFSCNQ
jgi:hypothetical protein